MLVGVYPWDCISNCRPLPNWYQFASNHAPQVCKLGALNSGAESCPSQQALDEAQTIKDIEHAPVSDDPRAWGHARKVRLGRCSTVHQSLDQKHVRY